jgi:hypothetical protein
MMNCISDVLLPDDDSAFIGPLPQLWMSHIRMGQDDKLGLKRLARFGMNSKDLGPSPTLTEWAVDLNDSKGDLGCVEVMVADMHQRSNH